MKCVLALSVVSASLCAQQITTATYDVNGRAVPAQRSVSSKGEGSTSSSQLLRSLNGRDVPIEKSDERVLTDTPTLRVVERIVRRFDPAGNAGPEERTRIETRIPSEGVEEVVTTVHRATSTGQTQLAERTYQVTRRSGQDTTSSMSVERPGSGGSLEVFERVESETRQVRQNVTSSTTLTSRKDTNGRFREVSKRVSEQMVSGTKSEENTAEYEAVTTGAMRLVRQQILRVEQRPNGGSRTEIDTYEPAADGRPLTGDSKPALTRQQIIESEPGSNGNIETVSVRMASANDPGKLGPERKVEQRTCQGDCGPRR